MRESEVPCRIILKKKNTSSCRTEGETESTGVSAGKKIRTHIHGVNKGKPRRKRETRKKQNNKKNLSPTE